jgi:hypothetical protein
MLQYGPPADNPIHARYAICGSLASRSLSGYEILRSARTQMSSTTIEALWARLAT